MKELAIIQSKLKAPKGQYNSFGKYKYRSCEDILEAVKPLLAETETTLTIADDIVMVGNRIYVKATTVLKNKAGEVESTTAFAREEDAKKGMDGSQVTGASSSYARKYALNGLFAIDDNKDSDSTNTHGKDAPQPQQAQPAAKTYSEDDVNRAICDAENCDTSSMLTKVWEGWKNIVPCDKNSEFYKAVAKKGAELKAQGK